jgi:ABC-type transport system substrate-binding protein
MNGKNLVVALTDVAPADLNPYKSNTLHIHQVMWSIYEPLFDVSFDRKEKKIVWHPCLADRWSSSPDSLTWDFHIREGASFSDGTRFDASSVLQNLERVQRQAPTSFRERILHDLIANVQLADGQTVRVTLTYARPELLFLALMTDGSESALGTGPFRFESRSATAIVLTRNPHYRASVKLAQITFRVIANPNDLVTEFNAQRLHLRDIDRQRLLKLENAQKIDVQPFGLHYLGFNWGSSAFRTLEVRQAFRDMLDFKQIPKTGLQPARGPIPPDVEGYAGSTAPSPLQSRAEARSILEKACGGRILLLYNANSHYGSQLAERIENDLGSSLVTRVPHDNSSQLLGAIRGRGHNGNDHYVFIYNWYSILPAPEIFLRPLFATGMRDNLTGYDDPNFNNVFTAIQHRQISSSDGYLEAQTRVINDMPAIFLGHSQVRHSAHSKRVTGVDLNVQSFPVDRYAGVDVI